MSKFAERFRQLKEEKEGMTLKELSSKLDITVPNLSYYMNGREPNYDTLIKIANYFDVTVDWLVGNDVRLSKKYKTQLSLENHELMYKLNQTRYELMNIIAKLEGL